MPIKPILHCIPCTITPPGSVTTQGVEVVLVFLAADLATLGIEFTKEELEKSFLTIERRLPIYERLRREFPYFLSYRWSIGDTNKYNGRFLNHQGDLTVHIRLRSRLCTPGDRRWSQRTADGVRWFFRKLARVTDPIPHADPTKKSPMVFDLHRRIEVLEEKAKKYERLTTRLRKRAMLEKLTVPVEFVFSAAYSRCWDHAADAIEWLSDESHWNEFASVQYIQVGAFVHHKPLDINLCQWALACQAWIRNTAKQVLANTKKGTNADSKPN